jgi:hypothetical protein
MSKDRSRSSGAAHLQREREQGMRIFVPALIVLAVLYFWDADYNSGRLLDGLQSMGRSISHSMGL